jgi:hypothetical protein
MKQRTQVEMEAMNLGPETDSGAAWNAAASASMVNRTHRVVRERAQKLEAQRSKLRSLWIPLTVSGGLLAVMVAAIWTILEQDELVPIGLPDANQQMLVLMMLLLPATVLLMAVVLYRRSNAARDNGSGR